MSERSVLFIVYEFPPVGGAGVQRILKFVKYLPEFGWQPIVLTTTPESHLVHDPALLRDVPAGTPVYRVDSPDINRLRPSAERLKLGKALAAANLALQLPDAGMFWARRARKTASEIVAQHRPLAIISSSPLPSTHLLARYLHGKAALPWVADFRDPWSQGKLTTYYPGYRALNERLERRVVSSAQHVTTVSPTLAGMLRGLHSLPQDKITIIENGYDEDDVEVLPPPATSRFTITYTGEFSRLRRPEVFVAAINWLIDGGAIPLAELRVVFAGKNTAAFVPARPPFEHLGYLSHDRLGELRRDSDLLLLIQGDFPTAPAKLYEYLGSNRPTLAIAAPDNPATRLVQQAEAGVAVDHDSEAIATAVLRYYTGWKRGEFIHTPDWDVIRRYSRRSLTGQLAGVLEALT